MKRLVQRPWGRRQHQGWIIQKAELLEALKKGDAIELDSMRVGSKQLQRLINLLPYEDCLVRANGRLEIETVTRVPYKGKDGHYRMGFRKPKHYHQFMAIVNGAWVPRGATKLVVLKPRKF